MDAKSEPLSIIEILELAREKEQQAHDFYASMLLRRPPEMVAELLERLMNEESKHTKLVEEMIVQINLGRDIA